MGNRILFGGGRNMDFETETTDDFALNNDIQESLDHYLKTLIIPKIEYTVAKRWAGIMAFGQEKWPLLKQVENNVILAGRMNGMGIAIGSEIGRQAAELVLQS
ncbi:MAG: FAD-binding oxidoreductase [Bacteroidetes bacterium]|nr:FAD-binding oxidoreductase [Bacteroidota bacterium]